MKKRRLFFIAFYDLFIITLGLFAFTATRAYESHWPVGVFLMVICLLMVRSFYDAFIQEVLFERLMVLLTKEHLSLFFMVTLGSLATYGLNHGISLHSVTASAVVGLLGAYFFKSHSVAIFCGTFAGMTQIELLGPGAFFIATVLVGSLFVLTQSTLKGYGGELGAIAFSGCFWTSILLYLAGVQDQVYLTSHLPGFWTGLWMVILAGLCACATFTLSVGVKLGPVKASALIGLLSVYTIPLVFKQDANIIIGAIYCASFVGMSAKGRMRHIGFIGLSGLLAGLVMVYAYAIDGLGGKLGTIAFGSTIAVGTIVNHGKTLYNRYKRGNGS